MHVTLLYAALLSLLFVYHSAYVIRLRRSMKVVLGGGNHSALERAVRVHGNFAEYVPFALLLLFIVEQQGVVLWFVHSLGLCLILGRIIHAYGLRQVNENIKYRVVGMVLTFVVLIMQSLYLLGSYVVKVWG